MDSSKIPNVEKIKRKTTEKMPNVAKTKAELAQGTKMKSKSIKEQIQLDPEIKSKDEHLSDQVQMLKKTRSNSEPLKVKASNEIQLRKSKSDNSSSMSIRKSTYSNHTKVKVKTISDFDHNNQVNEANDDVKQQDVSPDSEAEIPKHKGMINKITPDSEVNVEGESKDDTGGGGRGFNQLILFDATNEINLISKLSQASISTPTSATFHPLRSVPEPNLNSSTFPTASQESNDYDDNISKTSTESESHCKLQALVDLVMWRHVPKSAFIFGSGTFIIISSSYAKEFNFSLISIASYLSLVCLAAMFLYNSLVTRGVTERQVLSKNKLWGEEEAIWFVKLVLPYMNESVLKLRVLFSGDPAMTMKLAVVLFMLATYGSSITIGKMIKLGFFGVFVIPKLCSSYSSQITAWGNFWVCRFQDAWDSCSHKKALLFAIFSVVWNFASVVARAWAAFMLFVAFQYYQQKQSLITRDEESNFEIKRKSSRHQRRGTGSMSTSISIGQKKEKKNF
ncbi:unnamed protein product [Amaranthus hypochondriacus]